MALSTAVMVGEAKEWVHDIKAKAEKLVVTAGHEPTADLGNKKTLSRHFQGIFKNFLKLFISFFQVL